LGLLAPRIIQMRVTVETFLKATVKATPVDADEQRSTI